MSESVVVASGSARRDHLIWLSCKRNANQFAPITVESWPCRPIANLRSWPQATNKTPSVFQNFLADQSQYNKASHTDSARSRCIPNITRWPRQTIKTNLAGAAERLCVRSVRAALHWLLFLLAALVVFLLFCYFTCHFRMARSQIPLMEGSFSSDVSRQSEGSCFLESVEGKEDV